VLDASGQAMAYIYARDTKARADIAKVLTFDEARRIAVNVAKLPGQLSSCHRATQLCAGAAASVCWFATRLLSS